MEEKSKLYLSAWELYKTVNGYITYKDFIKQLKQQEND